MLFTDLSKILFLDIETVSQQQDFSLLDENMQRLWTKKAELINRDNQDFTASDLYDRAGIYAEFGKIICISVGFFHGKEFRLKSFYGDDEKTLLDDLPTP